MRILVRMPNWIGDAVMATPTLEILLRHFRDAQMVLVGSPPVTELFREDDRVQQLLVDETKSKQRRSVELWRLARQVRRDYGPFDLAWSFLNSFSSRLFLLATGTSPRVGKRHSATDFLLTDAVPYTKAHQVAVHTEIANRYLGTNYETGPMRLHVRKPHTYARPTVGINPGTAYGSAKRWPPAHFAEAAAALSRDFDLVLFGGPSEMEMVAEIETNLRQREITNFVNLAGRTSMRQLLARIAGLKLFITNDSGPMHIANALNVPTVAIFGPTNHLATSPWNQSRAIVVRQDIECAPCMKRICPLTHHGCMTELAAVKVIDAAYSLVDDGRSHKVA